MTSGEYPRMLFRYGHEPVTVHSEEEEATALEGGWGRAYPPPAPEPESEPLLSQDSGAPSPVYDDEPPKKGRGRRGKPAT